MQVTRPDSGGQAEFDIVGNRDRLLIVLELQNAHHRTEHLVLRNAHMVLNVGEDGRRNELPLAVFRSG